MPETVHPMVPGGVQNAVRSWAIGAGCGAIAGALGIGLGLRLAMRVSGALTAPQNRALATDAGMVVGRLTAGGTTSLVLLGLVLGVAGGLYYMLVRAWVPGRGARHALATGAVALALYGTALFEADNFDFATFGPLWLNIAMYASLFFLYAAMLCALVSHFDRRLPPAPVEGRLLAAALVPVVLSLPGVLAMVAFAFLSSEGPAWGAATLAPAVFAVAARVRGDAAVWRRPGRAVLAAACVAGLAHLTLSVVALSTLRPP